MTNEQASEKYLELAEKLAADNGGRLPTTTELISRSYAGLAKAVREHRAVFEHLLAKDIHGRDKEKVSIFESNLELPDDELAKLVGVIPWTLQKWRRIVREERGEPEPREFQPATLGELAAFVERYLPADWRMEVSISEHGTFAHLVTPRGARPSVTEAEDKPIEESIVIHLNFARKRAGLDPVEWGSE